MGLFSKLFGKNQKQEESTEEQTVFYANQDELMKKANTDARANFKYFWRELFWEYRRIVPAHDFAMVKVPFEQTMEGQDHPTIEHMWINNINFDGENISGELVNEPHQLTNFNKGDIAKRKVSEITDWMFSIAGKTYGGYTIQVMRSSMGSKERKAHDDAWGLDFGKSDKIFKVYQEQEHPENLVEHPMSINIKEKTIEFLKENPNEISSQDENGNTLLHNEAIAGNKTTIDILLDLGADKNVQSNSGKTPLDYAKDMKWEHIIDVLS